MPTSQFSIIIPTRNRYELLRKNVQKIIHLDYPENKYEIIIVNNSIEIDQTQKYIEKLSKKYKNIRFFQERNLGPSHARNSGIKMAKYPFQIFIDDDIEVTSSLLTNFEKAWNNHHNAIGIGGRILTKTTSGQLNENQEKLISQHSWVFGKQDKGLEERLIKKDEMLLSGTFGIHQKFDKLFLFDTNLGVSFNSETILYGEDFEFCRRIIWSNHEIWYIPDIITTNHINSGRMTSKYLSKRYFINGIEIYIADKLLKKRFPQYNTSYGYQLKKNFLKLIVLDLIIFKRFFRTKYDFIMMISYFFCGKYFHN